MKPRQRTGLKLFPTKKLDRKYIRDFWKNWQKPERARKKLFLSGREVLRVSPTTLGTVRKFRTTEEARAYVRNTMLIEKTIMDEKPKTFELQPVQFFSRKDSLLLEGVYRGPDVNAFMFPELKEPRYLESLKKRLKRKGIDLDKKEVFLKIKKIVSKAYEELLRIEVAKMPIATEACNLLFLDFDPKTKKVLFAIVDHEQPRSIQE